MLSEIELVLIRYIPIICCRSNAFVPFFFFFFFFFSSEKIWLLSCVFEFYAIPVTCCISFLMNSKSVLLSVFSTEVPI
jgi:hypothetical protein